jgi:hypothetical protein
MPGSMHTRGASLPEGRRMSHPADPAPAAVDSDAMPPRTTPTWEMELLLSGATVFALVQLIGVLDQRFYLAFPDMDAAQGTLWLLLYLYSRSAVLILAAAFAVHLGLRAHWVALVGLRSVFPRGIRLDRLRGGPQSRAVTAAAASDLGAAIERADNRATLVFGIGVGLALSIVAPGILVVAAYALAWLLHLLPGQAGNLILHFFIITALILLPMLLAAGADSLAGPRLAPDGLAARAIRRVLGTYSRVGMSQNANTLYAIFSTNFGTYRTTVFVLLLMFAAFGATMWSFYRQVDPGEQGVPSFWPGRGTGGAYLISGEHYADQRSTIRPLGALPWIASMQASGAWLPLTVPIRARVHGSVLGECPEPARATADPEADAAASARQRDALLACIAGMHAISIDGQPVEGVTWDFIDRPVERLRGVLAMVPIGTLATGRHELRVARPQSPERQQSGKPVRHYQIPFWKLAAEPRN